MSTADKISGKLKTLSKIIKFTTNIVKYYFWADIVICHAGAGTIYQLLEISNLFILKNDK